MDSAALQQALDWAQGHPGWLLALGLGVAFLEAFAILGIVVPGIFALFLLAAMAGWNPGLMIALGAAMAAGAMLGDGTSYWLGRHFGDRLRSTWPLRTRPHLVASAEDFLHRHGGKGVIIARFVGPIRPVVPLVAGALGMTPREFLPRMLAACLAWAPFMVVPGALFGESLEMAAELGTRLVLLLLVLLAGGWLVLSATRAAYAWTTRRGRWWLARLGRWLGRHPVLSRWLGPVLRPGQRETVALVATGLLLVFSLVALSVLLAVAAWLSPVRTSMPAATLAGSLRSPVADPFFVGIALAGAPVVLAVGASALALLLVVTRRSVALAHLAAAVGGGAILARVMAGVMDRLPVGPAGQGLVPDFPLAFATVVLGFTGMLAAREMPTRSRKWPWLLISAVLALFAFARFYLGLAHPVGLAAALALGMGWTALIGIAWRARSTRGGRAWRIAGVFVLAVAAATAWNVAQRGASLASSVRIEPERTRMDFEAWQDAGWRSLPRRRTVLGPDALQTFSAQWAGPLPALERALDEAGWRPLPDLDRQGIRAVFRRPVRPDRLPHIPRDFAGRTQDLARRLALEDGRTAVLRAWDSGLRLEPGDLPVWLIQARMLRPRTWLGTFHTWKETPDAEAEAMEAVRRATDGWCWDRPEPGGPWLASPCPGQPGASPGSVSSSSLQSASSRACGSLTASSSWACSASIGSTEASPIPSALASSGSASSVRAKARCCSSSRSID